MKAVRRTMMSQKMSIGIKAILLSSIILIAGCQGKSDTGSSDTSNSAVASVIDINSDTFRQEFEKFIKGETMEYTNYFTSNVVADDYDVNYKYNIIDTYTNQNAVYIKISVDEERYMYRFQLNEDGKIESYIKYELEA